MRMIPRESRIGILLSIALLLPAAAIAQNKADIAEELGLPGLLLDEGFKRTVRWYAANRSWWRKVRARSL